MAEGEYLVDRLELLSPRDYLSLRVEAHWDAEYGSAKVSVTFHVTKQQNKDLKYLFEDEDKLDDLDSGIGEAFEAALREVYPKKKWDSCVSGTSWTTVVEKQKA